MDYKYLINARSDLLSIEAVKTVAIYEPIKMSNFLINTRSYFPLFSTSLITEIINIII